MAFHGGCKRPTWRVSRFGRVSYPRPSFVTFTIEVSYSELHMITPELFRLSDEIEAALLSNKPVVALESTVIAHGLPRPHNLETAYRLEEIVRSAGAIPATIAILSGQICVGLNETELRQIANGDDIRKISIRDLPIAVAQEWDGATTVASTISIAHRVGIRVFVTGGIGGVHRGILPDISADLPELARTPIIVVCSGAKIVLDLPATREWLETHGIPVVGYRCDEMPSFYSRTSGLPVDVKVNSAREVLELFLAHRRLQMEEALLVTVPIPTDFEIPSRQLQSVLDEALGRAELNQISGRDLTPFLLSTMSDLTAGATLQANIALLENNARVAAEIAHSLAPLT
jgi:pseudouridylate synthase